MSWEQLNEALGGIPDLGGAAVARCVGRSELFDVEDPSDPRAEAARNLCGSCSARPECSSWFASLPKGNGRPAGTVAGVTHERPKPAPPRPPRPVKPPSVKPRQPPVRLDADQWLADQLADGPMRKSLLVGAVAKAGLSQATLERAARRLGVVSERLPGRRGPVVWRLPSDSDSSAHSRAVTTDRLKSMDGDPAA